MPQAVAALDLLLPTCIAGGFVPETMLQCSLPNHMGVFAPCSHGTAMTWHIVGCGCVELCLGGRHATLVLLYCRVIMHVAHQQKDDALCFATNDATSLLLACSCSPALHCLPAALGLWFIVFK